MKLFSIGLLTAILCISGMSHAQQKYSGQWTGKLNSYRGMQYPLNFELTENGTKLSGIVTTTDGKFRCRTKLTGVTSANHITISESKVMYISDSALLKDMCYITYTAQAKGSGLTGTYKGYYANRTFCDSGTFTLKKRIVKPVAAPKPSLPEIAPTPESKITRNLRADSVLYLTDGIERIIGVYGDFVIQFSDHGKEDGDSITIECPEINLRKTVGLKSAPQELKFRLSSKNIKIHITATNTGQIFPNTCNVVILDRDDKLYYRTSLKKEDSTTLIFKPIPGVSQ